MNAQTVIIAHAQEPKPAAQKQEPNPTPANKESTSQEVDRYFKGVNAEHSRLVDKKFLLGLTQPESDAVEDLGVQIEAYLEPLDKVLTALNASNAPVSQEQKGEE
jgi:hypothetical protein